MKIKVNDPKTSGERLELIKISQGLTNEEIGHWFKPAISSQAVQKWTVGKVPESRLDVIVKRTGVSKVWLALGEGEPFPNRQASFIVPHQQHVAVLEESDDPTATHIQIPRYDIKLSAGNGNAVWIVRESDDDPLFFRKGWFRARHLNPDSLRGMYIRGDSMEPYLQNHDTVIIDTADIEIADGEVYAIIFKSHFYVKELRKIENGVRIISRNPSYEPMESYHDDPPESFQNLGRVVWRGG